LDTASGYYLSSEIPGARFGDISGLEKLQNFSTISIKADIKGESSDTDAMILDIAFIQVFKFCGTTIQIRQETWRGNTVTALGGFLSTCWFRNSMRKVGRQSSPKFWWPKVDRHRREVRFHVRMDPQLLHDVPKGLVKERTKLCQEAGCQTRRGDVPEFWR